MHIHLEMLWKLPKKIFTFMSPAWRIWIFLTCELSKISCSNKQYETSFFWHNIFCVFIYIILRLRTLLLNFNLILHKNEMKKNEKSHFLEVFSRGKNSRRVHFVAPFSLAGRRVRKERTSTHLKQTVYQRHLQFLRHKHLSPPSY